MDVFFVISGFVITAMLMREWNSTGRIRLGRFYVRRFKRLMPALAVTATAVMVASFLLLSPLGGSQQTASATAAGAMLMAANVVIARTTGNYFDAPAATNPLLNTWSLSVEEQFYLIFPTILLVSWLWGKRVRRPRALPVASVVFVGVVSLTLALFGSLGVMPSLVPESLAGFYGPVTRAWEFAMGALLALGSARLAANSSRCALPLGATGAGMLLGSLWLITDTTPFPGPWTLLPVVGTVLLIAAGSVDTIVTRGLASAPMVAVGDRSYSIYLWHWPFIVFAQLLWPGSHLVLLSAAVVSLLPAYASFRWVEQPIRALPREGGASFARLIALTVIPPLALAGILGLAVSHSFWNDSVREYQAAIEPPHAGSVAGCDSEAWRDPAGCTWNRGAAGRPIYLVGDSHADQFSEALIAAATSSSRPLVSLSENACAYLHVSLSRPLKGLAWEANCMTYPRLTADYLATAQPGLVVIANSYWWFDDPSTVSVGAPGEPPSQDPQIKRSALSSGLSNAVRELRRAGHTVLLVQAIPQWGEQDSWSSWAWCSYLDVATVGCSRTMSMSEVLERQGAVADAVAAVASETGSDLLDLSSELCPDDTCSWVTPDGLVRYRDGGHITVMQSEALEATFARTIAAEG